MTSSLFEKAVILDASFAILDEAISDYLAEAARLDQEYRRASAVASGTIREHPILHRAPDFVRTAARAYLHLARILQLSHPNKDALTVAFHHLDDEPIEGVNP